MSSSSGSTPVYRGCPLKTYTIDLDSPPRDRYRQIARDYKDHLLAITPLFDEVLAPLPFANVIKFIARHILRRVYSPEEQLEIEGMVEETGLERYFFIAFNSFLDVFMGCTSGAVRVYDPEDDTKSRMMHLRTLDWGMEGLRGMSIQVDYVRGGNVVAKGITYAGYVGVLTGVRKDLSVSLNFRPSSDTKTGPISLRGHQLLVLLGMRPSISHTLRTLVLPPKPKQSRWIIKKKRKQDAEEAPVMPKLPDILESLPSRKSSPCYVLLSDGQTSAVLEKDISSARVHSSATFIASTNHDKHMEEWTQEHWDDFLRKREIVGMKELVADSIERKGCVANMYQEATKRGRKVQFLKEKYARRGKTEHHSLVKWLEQWPVRNECTHFSCILDPEKGDIAWARRYDEIPSRNDKWRCKNEGGLFFP